MNHLLELHSLQKQKVLKLSSDLKNICDNVTVKVLHKDDKVKSIAASAPKHWCLDFDRRKKSYDLIPSWSPNSTQIGVCDISVYKKLLKLRNPWGSTEWKGAYSEHDEATKGWKPYGGFLIGTMFSHAQAVKDDGVFWMPFNDFLEQYDYICLCAVNQNMSSLHLNMCEEYGPCGPLCGCAEGAVTYCLMCKGVSHLWCSSSLSTVQLINSFKNGTSIERAQKCCEVAARATVNIIAPNSRFAKTPDEGDLF